MVRILNLVSALNDGGVENVIKNFMLGLEYSNMDFIKHEKNMGEFEKHCLEHGSNVYYLPSKVQNLVLFLYGFIKILKNNRYDIVHIHLNYGSWLSVLILKLFVRSKVYVHFHLFYPNENILERFYRKILKYVIFRYSDVVFVCSRAVLKYVNSSSAKLELLLNPINLQEFDFDPLARQNVRMKYALGNNDIVIGCVARLYNQKNQEFLLRVLKKLPAHYKLVLVGGGEDFEFLKKCCVYLDLVNRVVFVGSVSESYSYYSAFDIFCLPSIFEGLGISAIEAQLNGLPTIVSVNLPSDIIVSENLYLLPLEIDYWLNTIKIVSRRDVLVEATQFSSESQRMRYHKFLF